MAGTKEIKRRIKSVKNTKKITKAMELVAASKMKRSVKNTLASRLYAEYSWEILQSIGQNVEDIKHLFFLEKNKEEMTGKILLILITSNRGLCGAYNAQVIKRTLSLLRQVSHMSDMGETRVDIVAVGKKGDIAMRRVNQNILASFFEIPDSASISDIRPVADLALSEFTLGKYDKVIVAYTDFVSVLVQKPNIKQILPISKTELRTLIENGGENGNLGARLPSGSLAPRIDYLFEGNKEKFISTLAEKLTRIQIYQMLLESNASEQSSRMVAMKNASEASGEMIDDLTLIFNKARQSNITREISEISAGMASVS